MPLSLIKFVLLLDLLDHHSQEVHWPRQRTSGVQVLHLTFAVGVAPQDLLPSGWMPRFPVQERAVAFKPWLENFLMFRLYSLRVLLMIWVICVALAMVCFTVPVPIHSLLEGPVTFGVLA